MGEMTITCPNCGVDFEVSENSYAAIVNQVRDAEFNIEVEGARRLFEHKKEKAIAELKSFYTRELKLKEEELAFYKDFKAKQSNKIVGESLEQYCYQQFEKIRLDAYPRAYFEKDNDSKNSGTKGDFIFRDYDEDGVEIVSIMFEMKAELDASKNKKDNKSHFSKLDKDRKDKNCEYAVLVSLLEPENEYYNAGIVDASLDYEKMYVVRPQCFLTIISILKNAAMNSMSYKHEIERLKQENIGINNFEGNLNDFKSDFATSVNDASKNFNKTIDEIDNIINKLEAIKSNLMKSSGKLNAAINKADKLTIKKLAKNSPELMNQFREL